MEYKKTNWVDHKTPVDAKRLNNIENAIDTLSKTSVTPGKLKTINGKSIVGAGDISLTELGDIDEEDIVEGLGYTPASVEEVPIWTDVEPDGSETTDIPSIRLGTGLITPNDETAAGRWNKSIPGNIFEIGSGTSPRDRRNSLEINDKGEVYLMGVGGYDGTNSEDPDVLPIAAGIHTATPETPSTTDVSVINNGSKGIWVGTMTEYKLLEDISENIIYYIKKS
jgi:hypothetical protein